MFIHSVYLALLFSERGTLLWWENFRSCLAVRTYVNFLPPLHLFFFIRNWWLHVFILSYTRAVGKNSEAKLGLPYTILVDYARTLYCTQVDCTDRDRIKKTEIKERKGGKKERRIEESKNRRIEGTGIYRSSIGLLFFCPNRSDRLSPCCFRLTPFFRVRK